MSVPYLVGLSLLVLGSAPGLGSGDVDPSTTLSQGAKVGATVWRQKNYTPLPFGRQQSHREITHGQLKNATSR